MKKYLLFATTALVALASCTSEDSVSENPAPEVQEVKTISFGSSTSAITRAEHTGAEAAGMLNNNFVVHGVKGNGSAQEIVFNNYNVNYVSNSAYTTTSNTNNWEYVAQSVHPHATAAGIGSQSIKYWDYADSQYDFIAYSAGGATAIATGDPSTGQVLISAVDASKMNGTNDAGTVQTNIANITKGAYTITGKADDLAKTYIADLVTAYNPDDYNKVVQFKFRSLSAKVRIALYETVPGYSVKDVVFYTDASTVATDGKAHLFTTGTDVFNEEGTYTVYFPTTGSANTAATDYNKAHLKFTAGSSGTATAKVKDFGALSGSQAAENLAAAELYEAAGKVYLGRSSNTAIYAGNRSANFYTVVIPNETGAVLNLKVNYTLLSTDGSGEVINVTGATAQVPAVFATWKSGYAYTYIFKISQNSNGYTGIDPSTGQPVGPEGLYPITFDAVVTETEDGVQETITTVADPSITTYSKGAVVTEANNEYKKNSNIYIIVDNGEEITVGTNANMYKIELEDGAAQTINEASVENLLAHGTYSGGTWTVTDANGKDMTATAVGITAISSIPAEDAPDGNAITVNGAVFNTGFAGTYAFEYIDSSSKKHYKIIKIVN